MPVSYNAMNPMTWWTLPFGGRSPTVYPAQPTAVGPIAIKATASDPGLTVASDKNSITIKGTTAGSKRMGDEYMGLFPTYDVARGMSVTLDIDKAPTKDVWGDTDYTEKNQRLFTLTTGKGWTAAECAQRLADKVNARDDFRATVKNHADGSATLSFARR